MTPNHTPGGELTDKHGSYSFLPDTRSFLSHVCTAQGSQEQDGHAAPESQPIQQLHAASQQMPTEPIQQLPAAASQQMPTQPIQQLPMPTSQQMPTEPIQQWPMPTDLDFPDAQLQDSNFDTFIPTPGSGLDPITPSNHPNLNQVLA